MRTSQSHISNSYLVSVASEAPFLYCPGHYGKQIAPVLYNRGPQSLVCDAGLQPIWNQAKAVCACKTLPSPLVHWAGKVGEPLLYIFTGNCKFGPVVRRLLVLVPLWDETLAEWFWTNHSLTHSLSAQLLSWSYYGEKKKRKEYYHHLELFINNKKGRINIRETRTN